MKARKMKACKNKKKSPAPKVWINPNSTFKGPRESRAWDHRQSGPPTASRLLELADIALDAFPPSHSPVKKKKAAA